MAFNSNTYHANKYRAEARDYLQQARDIKARAANGEAYDWELPRIAHFAKLAIGSARIARCYAAIRQNQKVRMGR